MYAGFAVLYGVCETVNGNWAQLDMTSELGASTTSAALALTAFWGMVTIGRVLFAAVQRVVPAQADLPRAAVRPRRGVRAHRPAARRRACARHVAFGLAGLGCSALLPLTISFGQEELTAFSAAVAGGVIAFYQLGYGIAAFGVGPLLDGGVELSTVYAFAAIVAVVMGIWSFGVAMRRPSPAPSHPQPG